MDQVKELRVMKKDNVVEVNVESDVVTALALLSVLVAEIEREKGIKAKKILEIVENAIKIRKKEPVMTSKKMKSELEALGMPIVKWLKENSCLRSSVIVDRYGIRLVQDEIGIPIREELGG